MSKITLAPADRPKFWYVTTIADGEKMRVRLLPGQWIPTEEKGEYLPGDTSYNISCNTEIREHLPVGTVFVCEEISLKKNSHYLIPAKGETNSILPIYDGPAIPYTLASNEMRKAFDLFKASIPQPSAQQANATAAAKPKQSTAPMETMLQRFQRDKKLAPPTIDTDGFHCDPDQWYWMIMNFFEKVPTLLKGDTGSGKTELVELLAKKVGLTFNLVDMSVMQDPILGLLGTHRLDEQVSYFDYAPFTSYIKEPGICLLDEISRAPAIANNILLPTMDGRRKLYMDMASSKGERVIELHENLCLFATANVGMEYSGTSQLDQALINRMDIVELAYLPKDIETKLLIKRQEVDLSSATKIANVAMTIRQLYYNGKISVPVSTRHTLRIAEKVRNGFPMAKAMELVCLPLYEGSNSTGERAQVRSAIAAG